METIELKASKRDTGKQLSKRIRRSGLIPGVYYTKGEPAISISAKPIDMRSIIYTSDSKMINLKIEGEETGRMCVLKDITFDPLTEKPLHFDLIGIVSDKKMHFEIPILLKGQSIGLKEGGIIQHILHKVPLECLPADMPTHIDLDITNLKLGKSMHISDIKLENAHLLIAPETVVVTCVPPRITGESKHETTEVIGEAKEN